MAQKILTRQDTAANWSAANPVLARGEMALDLTSGHLKRGDGVTAWNTLPYYDAFAGLPRVLAAGTWACQIEADATTGVITLRAVGPGPTTHTLTWDPATNTVTADGQAVATQSYVNGVIDNALVVGPVLLR